MAVEYILGIDGGGTKTLGRLEHLITGERFEQDGGSSSLTSDFEGACVTLMQIIQGLCAQADCRPAEISVVMGLAGAGNLSQVARLKRRLALPFAQLEIYNDARTSLFGANRGKPVAMVALGTGSVGGRLDAQQREHYVGGWGFPIGDEGSGAKVGFHAIQLLLNELDTNEGAVSRLGRYLFEALGAEKDNILNWLRDAKPAAYAELTPNIFKLAANCPKSQSVIAQHVRDVEHLIQLARKDQDIPVVLMGGLAQDTYRYLSEPIAEYCQLQIGSSLDGACWLARQQVSEIKDKHDLPLTKARTVEDAKEKALQQALLAQLNQMVSEERNLETINIDLMTSRQIVETINRQDHMVAQAIEPCLANIALAVDKIVAAFAQGGRLVYLGAGTSGRLGILDAVECPPTFSVEPEQVVGIIAGGNQAIYQSVEGAEDDPELARRDLKHIEFSRKDILVGIAASGRTPYVIGGLNYARERGATTIALSCNPDSIIAKHADIEICPIVGPEVLSGSTRMKSGTAQKLVLNMLTTAAMIRSGKSYENLMVDVNASNEKLHARAIRIVMQATECDRQTAKEALERSNSKAKLAILQILTGVGVERGNQALTEHGGFLRSAVEQLKNQER